MLVNGVVRRQSSLELLENPALESAEASADLCPGCPSGRYCERCPFSGQATASSILQTKSIADSEIEQQPQTQITTDTRSDEAKDAADDGADEPDAESWTVPETNSFYVDGIDGADVADEAYDPVALASSRTDLRETILSSMRSMAKTPTDVRIAEYLVSNLDERGWLKIDEAEVIESYGIDAETLAQPSYLESAVVRSSRHWSPRPERVHTAAARPEGIGWHRKSPTS